MKKKYYYLEIKDGEKVVKRIPTSLTFENLDREFLETSYQKAGQKIYFIASSTKENLI